MSACNELGNIVDPDKTLNNHPLFVDEANGDGDSFVLTGRTIEGDGVVVPGMVLTPGASGWASRKSTKGFFFAMAKTVGISSDMSELLVRRYRPASRSPREWSILWRGKY